MGTSRLVRNLGIGALGVIAAVAIACGGGDVRDAASTGEDGSLGEAGSVEAAPGRDIGGPLVDRTGAATAEDDASVRPQNAAGGKGSAPNTAPAPELQTSIDRKIVQTTSMSLQVEEVGGGFEEVGRIATAAGGFVASSKFSYKGEQQIGTVTIRVPSDAYQSVLQQLRGLAEKIDAEDSNASDVTEEYTDLESRLRNLQATHDQLLTLLGRAQTVTDILLVQDRLNAVTGEIERVKGRMQLLDNLTDLSTVTVHLRPVEAPVSNGGGVNLGETISEAWDDSLAFLGGVAEDVLTVLVFAWWVPVLAVPAVAVAWGMTRGRERAAVGD